MITNIIKKYSVKFAVGCGCATAVLGLASCSDFLDILPLNDVVLENYWTQKSDVESVRASCYVSLQSSDLSGFQTTNSRTPDRHQLFLLLGAEELGRLPDSETICRS